MRPKNIIQTSILITLLVMPIHSAFAADKKLCIDQFSKNDPIDLKVLKAFPVKRSNHQFFIQDGKIVAQESELSKVKGAAYCSVEYQISSFKPYSKMWAKGTSQPMNTLIGNGDHDERTVKLYPRPHSEWFPITYDCSNVSTYDDLKKVLNPILEVPCDDWGDLINKCAPGKKSCNP